MEIDSQLGILCRKFILECAWNNTCNKGRNQNWPKGRLASCSLPKDSVNTAGDSGAEIIL